MDGPTFQQAFRASRELEERRQALAATSREQARIIETAARRLELRRRELETLRQEIAGKERVIADAETGLGNERLHLAGTLAR